MKTNNLYNVLWHVNQFAFDDWNKSVFKSYNSICAVIDWKAQKITLGKDWNYSKTTKKHLYAFFCDMWLHSLNCVENVRNALKDGKAGDFEILVDYSL